MTDSFPDSVQHDRQGALFIHLKLSPARILASLLRMILTVGFTRDVREIPPPSKHVGATPFHK